MFFFSSRRRHTRWPRDWSSDVCSSDLPYMAYTLNGYSRLHQQRGDYELAEADMRRALEIGRSVFPEQHPFLAVVQHNLGKLFEVMQRYEDRSEEHTSELQSRGHVVCRLLLGN